MSTQDEISSRFETQLDAIATLDHAYYTNKAPTAEDRAAYFARQVELERVRACMYQELREAGTKKPPRRDMPYQNCSLKHDALNKLGVVSGRFELLIETLEHQPDATLRAPAIADAIKQMTDCLRRTCPKEQQTLPLDKLITRR